MSGDRTQINEALPHRLGRSLRAPTVCSIPVLILSPFTLLPWFSMDHLKVDTKGQRLVQLLAEIKELLFDRGKGRERQVPWEGLAGSLPFPASIHPLPGLHLPCRCPLPAVSGAFLWQQLLGADGPQGVGVGQQLAGQKCCSPCGLQGAELGTQGSLAGFEEKRSFLPKRRTHEPCVCVFVVGR